MTKQLSEMGHIAVGKAGSKAKKTTRAPATGKKRVRRSPEQMKADATKALAMIRKSGKEGIGGAEIRKSVPGVGQDIKGFVEKNAGTKLKTTGHKATMRYYAT